MCNIKCEFKSDITIIQIEGVIDITSTEQMMNVLNSVINSNRYKIIIDLFETVYISSTGWNSFLCVIRKVRKNRGDIKLVCMHSSVFKIFENLELNYILKAFNKLEDAISDFENSNHSNLI